MPDKTMIDPQAPGSAFDTNSTESAARLASLQAVICRETAEVCCRALGPHLSAIILTGSMARGEATFMAQDRGVQVLGDSEFFLVFQKRAAVPSAAALNPLILQIASQLRDRRVWCDVQLTPVHPEYFRRLRPTIFAYELRAFAQVAWGDPATLSLIPSISVADIPREDAWRLLLNRMIECLEIAPELLEKEGSLTGKFLYRLTKLYLDMATSFLVFAGEYQPTYRARAQALQQIAERNQRTNQFSLPLQDFSRRVSVCTEFKLHGGNEFPFAKAHAHLADQPESTWCRKAAEFARQLWRWELTQMTAASAALADCGLMELWMRRQPLARRLRGWLVVLRECGWHRSWRHWPRWMRLAPRASPRYWVYAVASELFFSLPELVPPPPAGDSGSQALPKESSEQLRATFAPDSRPAKGPRSSALPIVFEAPAPTDFPGWVKLAKGVAMNYHRFLEQTTS